MAKDDDILEDARELFRSCEEREADNRDEALADRRANDPLYWEQVRDHAQPVPLAVQNQTDFGNIYAERLDQRGVPRKGMPTLNATAAKPLAMPTPVQDGPYRQAQVPKPTARVSELSDKTALTVAPPSESGPACITRRMAHCAPSRSSSSRSEQ